MGGRLIASSSEVGGTQRDGNASSRGVSGHPKVGSCWARTDGETDTKNKITTTLKDRRFIKIPLPIESCLAECRVPLAGHSALKAKVYAPGQTACLARFMDGETTGKLPLCRVFHQDGVECHVEEICVRLGENERGAELDDVVMRPVGAGEDAAFAQAVHDIGVLYCRRLAGLAIADQGEAEK